MSLSSAAVAYANAGRKIFPCQPRGKEPLIGGGAGFLDANADPEVARLHWLKWPNANIGIACAPSRFFALDVDPRNGGLEELAKVVAEHGELPDTRLARTGGGGNHFLFKLPALPAGTSWKGKLCPGVDLKVNGYIIVPPSVHPSGALYQWENTAPLADAPQWLLDLSWFVPSKTPTPTSIGSNTPWFCKAGLENETKRVSLSSAGERNRVLNSAAFNLGGLIHLGLSRDTIEEHLMVAAQMAGLKVPESRKTITSGIEAGLKRPRGVPARRGQFR